MPVLLHELRLFFIALQFFTRCPVPAWVGFEPAWLQACGRYFPAVGLLVGAWSAAVLGAALWLWPPMVAVGLSMAASIWLTGGFHEDGWADSCDGLGGAVSREKALTIMKDSRIGSYGALGLILMLGLKAACLLALVEHSPLLALLALIWAHSASRLAPVWLMHALPYAGDAEHAKAKPLATEASLGTVFAGLLWPLALAGGMLILLPGLLPALSAASLAGLGLTWWMQSMLKRRLGGYTGDNLGATQQLVELGLLLGLLAVAHAA
ncbi:adenosylcobinamide-GDP ribazoletransferase [Kinneretia aquatilis]|uniref:adenosylcobinamide-GDP ribazoletransferase n=1 Tax=Kinneretia aquatilis TaxID=2070761 RepID=UPI0014953374|nr:adenosylcobinamide-GDP ribazoletransferase [Paucibacter aquatile]WIV97030.1 adenosylcobinamide-GDP ribazoletransferase [Paucibacter aquatile]